MPGFECDRKMYTVRSRFCQGDRLDRISAAFENRSLGELGELTVHRCTPPFRLRLACPVAGMQIWAAAERLACGVRNANPEGAPQRGRVDPNSVSYPLRRPLYGHRFATFMTRGRATSDDHFSCWSDESSLSIAMAQAVRLRPRAEIVVNLRLFAIHASVYSTPHGPI